MRMAGYQFEWGTGLDDKDNKKTGRLNGKKQTDLFDRYFSNETPEYRSRLYTAFRRRLTYTEMEVLKCLYGFRDDRVNVRGQLFQHPSYSTEEVAEMLKASPEKIQVIEREALKKLKAEMGLLPE